MAPLLIRPLTAIRDWWRHRNDTPQPTPMPRSPSRPPPTAAPPTRGRSQDRAEECRRRRSDEGWVWIGSAAEADRVRHEQDAARARATATNPTSVGSAPAASTAPVMVDRVPLVMHAMGPTQSIARLPSRIPAAEEEGMSLSQALGLDIESEIEMPARPVRRKTGQGWFNA